MLRNWAASEAICAYQRAIKSLDKHTQHTRQISVEAVGKENGKERNVGKAKDGEIDQFYFFSNQPTFFKVK